MPLPNPLKSLAGRLSRPSGNLPDRSLLMDRRAAAEAAQAAAERLYQSAALAVETDQPGAAAQLTEATEARKLADEKLRSIMSAQLEADTLHAEHERKAKAEAIAQENAATAQAWDDVAKAAKLIEPAILALRDAVAALVKAYQHAHAVSANNRRVRQDLIHMNIVDLVATELARLSTAIVSLPGAKRLVTGAMNLQPFAEYFNTRVADIKAGLNAR